MINYCIQISSVPRQLLTALRASIVFLVLCGFFYAGVSAFLGGLLFPHQAKGSLIQRGGQIVGSSLVGQKFESPKYFYGRPSAVNYDPMATAGSNLAPSNPALRNRVKADSLRIRAKEAVSADSIPVDLLAASGSGIDPDISPEAARIQAPRVAAARGVSELAVLSVIKQNTQGPQWGVFGQPRVNVLLLNLALDSLGTN